MEQQYYTTITLDDLKRLYPNISLENVQVVSVAGGVSDDTQNSQQQVILAPDESIVLNEAPIQQLVAYQQPSQNTQAYIIQNTENDNSQQTTAVAQSNIYYSTEVPNDQLMQQHQQVQQATQQQQQQQQHLNISHQVHQDNTQSNIILQKSVSATQQQTSSIIQQPLANQTPTHQHVIMQQTPHIVLQSSGQQHQQQAPNQIVLRPMHTNNMNQQRYVYQHQPTRVVYSTQPQATLQANQQQQHHVQTQQTESTSNRLAGLQQQPTRQLIITSQPQMQANLIYQSPHQQLQQQQLQHQQQQQAIQFKRNTEATLTPTSRIVRPTRVPPLMTQTQAPMLTPIRTGVPRFQSPTASVTTATTQQQTNSPQAVATPTNSAESTPVQKATVVKQPNRRTNTGRGRVNASPRGGARSNNSSPRSTVLGAPGLVLQKTQQPGVQATNQSPQVQQQIQQQTTLQQQQPQQQQTQPRTIQFQSGQVINQNQQQQSPRPTTMPALVSTPSVTQRLYNAALGGATLTTPKGITTATQITQRVISTQTQKNQVAPAATIQPNQIQPPRYRIPKLTSTNDLEESIQAVVVTKPNEQTTTTQTMSSSTESLTPKPFHTTLTTYNTTEASDDEKKGIKVNNGRVLTLTEFKRQQQQQQQLKQQQQQQQQLLNKQPQLIRPPLSTVSRPNNMTNNSPATTIQRTVGQQVATPVPDDTKKLVRIPQQNQHIIQPITNNRLQNASGDTQKSARMLVVLSNGEQRLITFTLPRESCTVQELLEQVGVPFTPKTSIQCVPNPGASIDYIVTVGINMNESPSAMATAAENTLQLAKQQQEASAQNSVSNEQNTTTNQTNNSAAAAAALADKQAAEAAKETPTKLIPGFLAVCTQCGYTGLDFAKCERCKRVFTEEPKRVATAKGIQKQDDDKKKSTTIPQELLNRAAAKATLTVSASNFPSIRGGKVLIATTASGRGRGRGVTRVKPAEVEPVILTLSSDDEGDDEKSNKSIKTPIAAPSPPVLKPPLSCEPIIPESIGTGSHMEEREDIAVAANSPDQLYTTLTCRIIRFGTYRYDPKEKVLISSKGIKIVAPSCKNPLDSVVLNIQMREIVKIIAHFSKSLNVLFLYTLGTCGSYIRECLEMKPKSPDTPYYNPTDRAEPYKRIVLQMESTSEEAKSVIRSIFSKLMLEEVQCSEANELLVRSCLKDKYLKLDPSASKQVDTENIRQILIYPPGKGGIPINTEDYMCLAIDQYLNDVIIDFYLSYLHTNVLSDDERQKTHIFSSFFYNRLTTMTTRQRHSEKDVKLTASQKRHARVKSWTKNVNLFEKDFIIIPINEQSHWFLAIICFPRLQGPVTYDTHEPVVNQPTVKKKKTTERKVSLQIGSTTITPLSKREIDAVCLADDSLSERDEAEGDDSDLASDESDSEAPNGSNSIASNADEKNSRRPIKQPLILIFDSLAGASRSRVVATLRDYLTCEYRTKIKEDSAHVFNKLNMPGHCVKVPQQNNFTDCGLYVLQYVEQFFKDPIKDYKVPIKQLVSWFETIVVTRKREEISNLLKELVEKLNPDRLPLPEIVFPTLNGKLIETETDEQAEFEEEDMDDEGEEEDEDEFDSLADVETEGETSSPIKRNGEKRTITLTPNATTITLKRSLVDTELSRSQDGSNVRKTARLNETA